MMNNTRSLHFTEKMKKEGQLQLQAMWFAAGTAAFMACLERAVLVSVVEQWRAVVFLALNLLLLAILFTSPTSSPPPSATTSAAAEEVELELEPPPPTGIPACHEAEDLTGEDVKLEVDRDAVEVEEDDDDKGQELSEEEFNKRVEAFIATFRQHLVSDAKGQSCRSHCSSSGGGHHRHRGSIAMRL